MRGTGDQPSDTRASADACAMWRRRSVRLGGRPQTRGTEVEADGTWESEGRIGAMTPGNEWRRTRTSKGGPC
jgi:hypothetical protein